MVTMETRAGGAGFHRVVAKAPCAPMIGDRRAFAAGAMTVCPGLGLSEQAPLCSAFYSAAIRSVSAGIRIALLPFAANR
jgi:hypothetical protein